MIERRAASVSRSIDRPMIVDDADAATRRLLRLGGLAALFAVACALVQITIETVGVAVLHIGVPTTVPEWFALLHGNTLLAVTELTVFQIPLFVAVIPVLLALRAALRHVDSSLMLAATVVAIVGIAVYVATNSALPLRALSDQWAAAPDEASRSQLVTAGQAALAIHQNIGLNVGLFLVMSAILVIAWVSLRSRVFSRLTGFVAASGAIIALLYYVNFIFPAASIFLLEGAGVLIVVWLLLAGRRLLQLSTHGSALEEN